MGTRNRPQARRTDWAELCMEIWIGLFIAFYLLFTGFRDYRSISGEKTVSFYILMGLLLGLGLWRLIRELLSGKLRPLTPSQWAALAFLAFTLLSAALSQYRGAWFDQSAHEAALTVSLYVLLFLVVSRWGVPKEALFRVLFFALTAFCLICLLQFQGENPFFLYPPDPQKQGAYWNFYDGYNVKYPGAYAGTIGNVDFVSAFLALVTPMLLLHALGQRPRKAWPCWLLAAVCLGIAIWLRVLCGLVGLALGGTVCVLVLCPDQYRKWLLLGVGLLALAAVAVLWFFDLPIKFLHELHEILHGRAQDSFGTGRFYIWRQMLERIPERLWTGVGPDMTRYSQLAPFVRHDELGNVVYNAKGQIIKATITDAHCYPLQILYCQGLPALLSWLTLVGLSLRNWYKARANRAVRLLGGGAVCFLCAMLFCPSSIIIMPFFWLTLALIEAAAAQVTSDN